MSWCDKLASTPTIGFFLEPHFAPSDAVVNAVTPMLDRWISGRKLEFNVTHQETFRVDIQHENGFIYRVEPTKLSLQFQHRLRLRPTSGALPVAEFISHPHPFTRLLEEASESIIEMALLLPSGPKKRSVTQIGVVSTTQVNDEDLPPGLKRLIEFLGKPWPKGLSGYSVRMTADITETSTYADRCIHNISRSSDDENDDLITLQFDYQRYSTSPTPLMRDALKREVASATKGALAYFETLAVGDMFDEQIAPSDG
ncbi:hypothetical protein [Neomesorhizobium albiziae]|nr:hypothetical protein [Mesorhizobium albiziae]